MFMCMPIISMISIGVISISITITNLCSVFIGVGIMISTSSTYVRKYIHTGHSFVQRRWLTQRAGLLIYLAWICAHNPAHNSYEDLTITPPTIISEQDNLVKSRNVARGLKIKVRLKLKCCLTK